MGKNPHHRGNTNFHPPVVNGRMKQHMVRLDAKRRGYLKPRWKIEIIDMSLPNWSNRRKKRKRLVFYV